MNKSNAFIDKIFSKLTNSSKLNITINSNENSKMCWNYNGFGQVITKKNVYYVNYLRQELYFYEDILLNNTEKFTDRKLWIYENEQLYFCRYRNGAYEKIITFIYNENKLISKESYICGADSYSGKIEIHEDKVLFEINILGISKNEKIIYNYY